MLMSETPRLGDHELPDRNRLGEASALSRSGFFCLVIVLLLIGLFFTVASLFVRRYGKIVSDAIPPTEWVTSLRTLPVDDRKQLMTKERKAFLADPLDRAALNNLSLLEKVEDNDEGYRALALLAGDRSLRDTRTQADVLTIMLERKDYAGALYRLDGLLRSKAAPRGAELVDLTARFADESESQSALAAVLSENPPWRQRVMGAIVNRPNSAAVFRLFSKLRKTQAPPTTTEFRAFLANLVAKKQFELAYFVWLDSLSEVELRKAGHVYDGDFDLAPKNLYFGWTFEPQKNVDIRVVPRATSSTDRMLRIGFFNLRDRFANVSQLMRLSPGATYILSGETKAEELNSQAGLVWRFYCLGESERPIGATQTLPTPPLWVGFETEITVPADDCDTQRLRLEVDAKSVLDQKISGTVYIDQISLRRKS